MKKPKRDFFDIAELTKEFMELPLGNADGTIVPEFFPAKAALSIAQQLAVMNSHLSKIEKALNSRNLK